MDQQEEVDSHSNAPTQQHVYDAKLMKPDPLCLTASCWCKLDAFGRGRAILIRIQPQSRGIMEHWQREHRKRELPFHPLCFRCKPGVGNIKSMCRTGMAGRWRMEESEEALTGAQQVEDLLDLPLLQRLAQQRAQEIRILETDDTLEFIQVQLHFHSTTWTRACITEERLILEHKHLSIHRHRV